MINVAAIHRAMHKIAATKGLFTLYALFKRPDAVGFWDLVVAAPWLRGDSLTTARALDGLLKKAATMTVLQDLGRLQVIPEEDPTLQDIITNFELEDGENHLIGPIRLFGLEFEEIYIFRAKAPESKKRVLRPTGAESARARRKPRARPARRPRAA